MGRKESLISLLRRLKALNLLITNDEQRYRYLREKTWKMNPSEPVRNQSGQIVQWGQSTKGLNHNRPLPTYNKPIVNNQNLRNLPQFHSYSQAHNQHEVKIHEAQYGPPPIPVPLQTPKQTDIQMEQQIIDTAQSLIGFPSTKTKRKSRSKSRSRSRKDFQKN